MRDVGWLIDLVLKPFEKHSWKIMQSRDDNFLQSSQIKTVAGLPNKSFDLIYRNFIVNLLTNFASNYHPLIAWFFKNVSQKTLN